MRGFKSLLAPIHVLMAFLLRLGQADAEQLLGVEGMVWGEEKQEKEEQKEEEEGEKAKS